ncbi:hypothetical protein KTJ34_09485 [Acinetobacter courvalinii]|uniref:hypothetical protein n=1 Tax=Acinetobacter courvalinii TaxID=280147 RepID=UPI0021D23FCD|nr:hypothetical protein [Acinetobacter courvalinii]MCU4577664.1 hypothetical protein [Acinetobacter courvalinii]
MQSTFKYICISLILLPSAHGFAENPIRPEEKAVYQDIGALLSGQPQGTQITPTRNGVYVEALFCRKQTSPFTTLLKGRLSIQQDQALLSLFQNMFCAPADKEEQVSLSVFANQIQDPLPFSLVSYSGMQELGQWSLEEATLLSTTPAKQVEVNMFGLHPRQVSNSVVFWEVLSPTHVRAWYGMFKMAPSDAIIYEFKFADQAWKLSHLWMGTRL